MRVVLEGYLEDFDQALNAPLTDLGQRLVESFPKPVEFPHFVK